VTCEPPPTFTQTSAQNSATLSWTAQVNALRYQVRYRAVGASNWSVTTTTNPNLTINGLNPCTRYEFALQSTCVTGDGAFSTNQTFVTSGCVSETDTTQCSKPATFYFGNDYMPLGELKIGQGRLFPIFGQSTDAYMPQNRVKWAISMIHGAHLFKNIAKLDGFDANYLWASALTESRCGCDGAIVAGGNHPFPLVFDGATQLNGCYQMQSAYGYAQLSQMYPLRFPAGQQAPLVAYDHFTTASLASAYNDLAVLRYWESAKGWQAMDFVRASADPKALIRLLAAAHKGGAWQPAFEQIFKMDRRNALLSKNLSSYFADNATISTYQKSISDLVKLFNNQATSLDALSTENNPSTGLPYNFYDNYYDTPVSWKDIEDYINDIKKIYVAVNLNMVKTKVRAKFNSMNNGNKISFRYQLGAVLNELLLNLPADDPTTAITNNYGCTLPSPVVTTTCEVPVNLVVDNLPNKALLHWAATAQQYSIYYKKPTEPNWFTATKAGNDLSLYYSFLEKCQTYVFKVKGICPGNKESDFSVEGTFQVPCNFAPPANQSRISSATMPFEIAPNPSDILQISFALDNDSEQNTLEIGNLQGQILKTIPMSAMPKGVYELTIPESKELAAGFYWITLKTEQSRWVKKWLKQ
jgi:hypothetical protein